MTRLEQLGIIYWNKGMLIPDIADELGEDQETIECIVDNEAEGFEERVLNDLGAQWQVFTHCLAIYNLQKKIKKED